MSLLPVTPPEVLCPICGRGDAVRQTAMAFLGPDVFRDSNTAECGRCNNRGTVGDWLRIAFLRAAVASERKLREVELAAATAQRDAVTRHRDDLLEICRRDSEAAHEAVLSGRDSKLKWGAMLPRDAVAELVQQRDAATAQRDELLRAAVKVSNTSPRTSSSNERELDHYDACTELGIVIERIARAQSGQPASGGGARG